MNRRLFALAGLALALVSADAEAQDASARTVQYHTQDNNAAWPWSSTA